MGYQSIRCPICGSDIIKENENGRFTCQSCNALFESKNILEETNFITELIEEVNFETAENRCRDSIDKNPNNPVLNWLLFLAKYKIHFVYDSKSELRKPVFYSDRIFIRDCVLDDENYKASLLGANKSKYQRFGEQIESIRVELCEKLSKEDRIDIFISFKATEEVVDSEGQRKDVDTFDQKKD